MHPRGTPVRLRDEKGICSRMSPKNSPFVTKAIVCPCCKKSTEQRFFRQRLFMPEEKEADQHVTKYKWLTPDVERAHPPFYFFFLCTHCFYTDTTEDFANPHATVYGSHVLKCFKKGQANGILIQMLGRHVDYDRIDFESALNLHYLAILTQSLPEDDLQDRYKIARFYLRLAWLFRERANGEIAAANPESQPEAADEEPDTSTTTLHAIEAMEEAVGDVQAKWGDVKQGLQKRIREMAQSPSLGSNPYLSILASLNALVEKQGQEVAHLKEVCLKDFARVTDEEPGVEPGSENEEGSKLKALFSSHDAYLEKVKRLWPDMPQSERDATLKAIEYFKLALASDPRFDNIQNNLTITTLVVELLLGIDDMEEAQQMVRSMYTSTMAARQGAQQALQAKPEDPEERKRIEVRLKRASSALEQAADLRDRILGLLAERDMPRIQKILKQANGQSGTAELLVRDGISPEVVTFLQKSGKLTPQPA